MTVTAVRQGQVGHLVVLPDTQMATSYEHSVFIEQIEYLIQSKPDLVLFTGDMGLHRCAACAPHCCWRGVVARHGKP
jgi:hypothetical protein